MFDIEIHKGNTGTPQDYYDIAEIVLDGTKTKSYCGGYGVFTDNAYWIKSMMNAFYNKYMLMEPETCAFHVVISFPHIRADVKLKNLFEYMEQVSAIIGRNYQMAFGIHHNDYTVNAKILRVHMVINAVPWRLGAPLLHEAFLKMYLNGILYQACAYMANPLLDIE